jgi:hypothetical protein
VISLAPLGTIALATILVLGCTNAADPTTSPDLTADPTAEIHRPTDDPTDQPSPTPIATAIATRTPRPTDSPPPPPPAFVEGREASDLFWENFYAECFFGAFRIPKSLKEMAAQSNLVISGTIVDLYTYPRNGSGYQGVVAIVAIGEVIKGEPVIRRTGDPDVVHVIIGNGYDMDHLRSSLPGHDNLWFLTQNGDAATYYSADYLQLSVLREIDGSVRVIRPNWIRRLYDADHYPVPLEGTNFAELVERVREIVKTPVGAAAPLRLLAC